MNVSAADMQAVQDWYTHALRDYWQHEYRAYLAGEETLREFLEDSPRSDVNTLPEQVAAAYTYYYEQVELADWGNVRVHTVTASPIPTYAVYVTTDGDDGWLEVYQHDGSLLGAARLYIELIGWAEVDFVRAQTQDKGFPPTMDLSATLWGKPLTE